MLFTFGILLRDQEVAFLESSTRFLSSIGYRLQYTLGTPGQLAALGSLPASSAENTTGTARAIPVLLYHGIVVQGDRFSLTENDFKEQLFALKRAGYETVTLEEFLAFSRGERELPERSFLLTFDDGRRDSYERADPLLEALGYTAVMFIATDASIDAHSERTRYYLDREELARMIASGRWELGSHARQVGGGILPIDAEGTTGNFLSNRTWRGDHLESEEEYVARIENELAGSRASLERAFPIKAVTFSYPFGDYGNQTVNEPNAVSTIREIVGQTYDAAFKQVWPLDNEYSMNYPNEDPHVLRRIEVETDWSGDALLSFLRNVSPKSLPYHQSAENAFGWKFNWGIIEIQDGNLVARATNTTTGSFGFLDGTGDWTDYTLTATVTPSDGTSVSLTARYENEGQMVLCTFTNGSVRLEERVNDVAYTLADGTYTGSEFGISVEGNSAECLADGTVVASGAIDSILNRGGIGVRVWNEAIASASASFTNLTATALP